MISPKRARTGLTITTLGIWIAHWLGAFQYPLGSDPAIFQYHGWAMGVGEVPYRDSFEFNTPGIIGLHWAWGQLAGFHDGSFHLLTLLVSTAALVGVGWHLRTRVSDSAWILGLCAGVCAFVVITPWDRGQRELFQGILLLASFGVMGRISSAKQPTIWVAASGLLAGIATTLKWTITPLLWLCWMFWMSALFRTHPIRRSLRYSLTAVVGFMLPLVAVVWWLWQIEALTAFWSIQTTYLPLHANQLSVPWQEAIQSPLALTLLGLGLVAVRRSGAVRALGVVHLATVVLYLLQGHGWTYHLHIALPFVFPTVALLPWPPRAMLLALLPLGLALQITVYDHTAGLSRAEQVDEHWVYSAQQQVAERLRTGPEADRVLTNNDEQQLLYLAQRRAATPYLYGFLCSESHSEPLLKQHATNRIDLLHREPPQWVVWNTRPYRPELDSLEANPTLAWWIESQCTEEAAIPPYRIWRCGAR